MIAIHSTSGLDKMPTLLLRRSPLLFQWQLDTVVVVVVVVVGAIVLAAGAWAHTPTRVDAASPTCPEP